jgi:2-oxoglutarate dehydrogenase E2 component (dihydrolipoamide succinyltransferase)
MIEIKVPSPGESVTEVEVARWLVADGDYVEKDEEIAELDSDKATLTVTAEKAGVVRIGVQEGEKAEVGAVLCTIDESARQDGKKEKKQTAAAGNGAAERAKEKDETEKKSGAKPSAEKQEEEAEDKPESESRSVEARPRPGSSGKPGIASPVAEKMMKESRLAPDQVRATGPGGRITKGDVLAAIGKEEEGGSTPGGRSERREKMSMLRRKVSERLVSVKQQTAMLTTFNEVDMQAVVGLRKKYKEAFSEKHGVGLGFMSFFVKAVCEALKAFPAVNARIDGEDIVYHDYCDIGIAVSAPKGLMVPVIRNAESLPFAGIEEQVLELAGRARGGKLSIGEMTGGTFTITNGGVFGSMLSTPILNPPQSAILGMHNIVDRPVAVNGKVVVRPVMYVALSYDHRIIDGRESVSFLKMVKELLETPVRLLLHGADPERKLLGL